MKPRPQGVVVTMPDKKPLGVLAIEAEQLLKAKQERLAAERARRAAIPVPNRICYAETAFKDWQPGMPIPKCRKCQGLLHPEENHVCPGYHPKYPMLPSSELSFEERKALRQAAWDDWDDDQFDRTTDGDIPINPDEEDSGTVQHCEYMTEEDWIAAKRRRMGLAPDYNPPDFEPEVD